MQNIAQHESSSFPTKACLPPVSTRFYDDPCSIDTRLNSNPFFPQAAREAHIEAVRDPYGHYAGKFPQAPQIYYALG